MSFPFFGGRNVQVPPWSFPRASQFVRALLLSLAVGSAAQVVPIPKTPSPEAPRQVPGSQPNPSVASQTFLIQGTVRSGNVPIPGATVTATDSATNQKVVTWTDLDGNYSLHVPTQGSYTIRVEMTAFAPVTHDVTVGSGSNRTDLTLILRSRSQQAASVQPRPSNGTLARGFQSLALVQSAAAAESAANGSSSVVPSGMPIPGVAQDSATESIAFSGAASGMMSAMSSDELQQRIRDYRDQQSGFGGMGGGFGAPGGSGFGGGRGGGGGGGVRFLGEAAAASISTGHTGASITRLEIPRSTRRPTR